MKSAEKVVLGVNVNENWAISLSNMGVEALRYRIPVEMNVEKIQLYVKDAEGNWKERDFTVIGSYLNFDFTDGEQGFALYEVPNSSVGIVLVVIAVVFIIVVVIFIRKKKPAKAASKE